MSIPSSSVLRRDGLTATWAALVAITVLSFWVGTDHGVSSARLSGAMVVALGFLKAVFVLRDFMEVGSAPRAVRMLLLGWVVATGVIVESILLLR